MLNSPLLLFASVWLLVTVSFFIAQTVGVVSTRDEFSLFAPAAIALSVLGWAAGELIARFLPMQPSEFSRERIKPLQSYVGINDKRAYLAVLILLACSAIGYVSFIKAWSVVDAIRSQSLAEAYFQLNVQITDDLKLFGGFLGRLYVLPVMGLALTSYLMGRRRLRTGLGLLLLVCFVFMLISPRRALLIQGALLAAFVYESSREQKAIPRVLLITAVTALALFAVTQVLLAKADETPEDIATAVAVYIGANIPTMDVLQRSAHFESTHVLLNVPFRALNELFGTWYQVDLDVPFIDVGAISNTVPFQYYIAKDAGLAGVLAISSVLGFLAQMATRAAASRGTFGAIWMKSAFLVFIVFSFREFTLITYDWLFFLIVSVFISLAIHTPHHSVPARAP